MPTDWKPCATAKRLTKKIQRPSEKRFLRRRRFEDYYDQFEPGTEIAAAG